MSSMKKIVDAQRRALNETNIKHLIGPVELKIILERNDRCLEYGLTLSTLCDMVLGEDANDRSDDALIRGVRELINKTNKQN